MKFVWLGLRISLVLIVIGVLGVGSATTAGSDDLLGRYETSDREFERLEIGDKIIYFYQRRIDDAIVEKDYIVYQFDRNTKELLAKKTHWRSGLPEQLPLIITKEEAESMVGGEVQFSRLYFISPESDVFPLTPPPENPCWVVRSVDDHKVIVTIIDAVEGMILGYGIPPPYTGFTLAGPNWGSCDPYYTKWAQNAEEWFEKMGYDTEMVDCPTDAKVRSHIQSTETAMFYELAHGGSTYFHNICPDSEGVTADEVETWIAGYTKMPFTFLGSCEGMCDTSDGTLSYEFRKGSVADTVTVGYCFEANCDTCWNYSIEWQDRLFEKMNDGWMIKGAFDQAMADYPACALDNCIRFAGDQSFAVVPVVGRVQKKWSVMVYLAADNSLGGGTPSDPDFMDFDEMEKALATSEANVNILVLWDKPGTPDTELYWVQPDSTEGTLATYTLDVNKWYIPSGWSFDYSTGYPHGAGSPSEENMGDPVTLTNFMDWVFNNFSSDYYALILWNHGGGWEPKSKAPPVHHQFLLENGELWEQTFWPPEDTTRKKTPAERREEQEPIGRGICWDETDGSYLTTKEVATGISGSSRGSVENLGFDACLMQVLAVAYEVRTLAYYLTASQESEWGYGWAYHEILSGITSSTTPLDLALVWGSTRAGRWHSGGLDTISSLDLSQVGTLAADVSALGNQLSSLLSTNGRYQEIMYSKLLSLDFAYNEFLDLDWLCYLISMLVNDTTAQNLAQQVRNDIANTVVALAGNGSGISIYMPHYHDISGTPWHHAPHSNYTAANFAFCNDYAWDDFLNGWIATDYPDPHESNNTPAAAHNRGTLSCPNCLYLFREADFDDSTADWYKFTVPFPTDLWIYAWCTEKNSDTVIYLYDSQANAEADSYFDWDDDGLHWDLGRNQLGSYLHASGLSAGTYYLKVIPWHELYGADQDYEVWVGTGTVAGTPAVFRVTERGDVFADQSYFGAGFETGGADVAEYISASEPLEPGDVIALDPQRPGHYCKSRKPYSTLAAGVISTAPGVTMGGAETAKPLPILQLSLRLSMLFVPKPPPIAVSSLVDNAPSSQELTLQWSIGEVLAQLLETNRPLLALMGVVPVKATTENGPIKPGDLLTTSSTPGHAMRCDDIQKCEGAIIGKAMEPLEEGNGLIKMLVMR